MEIKQVVANPRLAALLLASASFDVQNAAACVLCNLSFKAVFAVAIAASGAVPHLLALLAASPRLVDRERERSLCKRWPTCVILMSVTLRAAGIAAG